MSELLDLGGHGLGRRYDALNAGWRGAMVRALGIEGADVQWVPGALDARLVGTVAGLSTLADRVPPATATAPLFAAGRSMPRWSGAYRRLLGALLPEIGVGLRGCLGATYPNWVRYRNAAAPDMTQRALFSRWAQAALPIARRPTAFRLFDAAARDPVSRARDAFGTAKSYVAGLTDDGQLTRTPRYAATPADAMAARFAARGGRLSFDSAHLLPADSGALAPGGARRPAMLPALRGDAFDPLEKRLAATRILVRGNVGARAVVPVVPQAWYDPEIVARALAAGPCATVWDGASGHGGWSAFFGSRGTLLRHAAHLVFVSDLRLSLSYSGQFDGTEQARILAGLGLQAGVTGYLRAHRPEGGGIWPFVIHAGQSPLRATARFDARGSLRLDLVLPEDRLIFWGVRVGYLTQVS